MPDRPTAWVVCENDGRGIHQVYGPYESHADAVQFAQYINTFTQELGEGRVLPLSAPVFTPSESA